MDTSIIAEGGAPACAVTRIYLEPKVQVGLLAMHQAINMRFMETAQQRYL